MHYRNGRGAKPGDQVISLNGPYSKVGYLVNLQPQSTACNATLLTHGAGYDTVTVSECLHFDDAVAAIKTQEAAAAEPPRA